MKANPPTKLEFLETISKFRKRDTIFVVACLRTLLGTGHYLSPQRGGEEGQRIFAVTTEHLRDPPLKHAEWV